MISGWGVKIPHALKSKNQNMKQKQYCNKFNKDFKNGPHQKFFKKKKKGSSLSLPTDFQAGSLTSLKIVNYGGTNEAQDKKT